MSKNEKMSDSLRGCAFWGVPADEATGLPLVPDGYFWRVVTRWYGWNVVELRLKRRFGSRYIGYQPIAFTNERLTAYKIALAAAYAMLHGREIKAHFSPIGPLDNSAFFGDYPPRSL